MASLACSEEAMDDEGKKPITHHPWDGGSNPDFNSHESVGEIKCALP